MRNSVIYRVLAGILIAILACAVIFWATVIYPINKFAREESSSIVKFDSLNNKIAEDLPPPPDGIEFIKTQQLGLEYPKPIHGRVLIFSYLINDEISLTDEEILSYYQTILQFKGWEVSYDYRRSSSLDKIEFRKNTACVLIDVFRPEVNYREQVEITIWHDYLNQSFSPTLPKEWVLDIIDLGKTDIWTCPYG